MARGKNKCIALDFPLVVNSNIYILITYLYMAIHFKSDDAGGLVIYNFLFVVNGNVLIVLFFWDINV